MTRFDRYLLSQLLMTFGVFALILVSVYWVNRAVSLFDRILGDGNTARTFFEFTALTLPNVILLVLPVAAFVAAIYVINRLSTESELVIAQAAGMSIGRILRSLVVFGLIVAAIMTVLTHLIVPLSRNILAERQAQLSTDVTSGLLRSGDFVHPADGVTFYVREISALSELLDVVLADTRDADRETLYVADRAILLRSEDGPRLVMFDGTVQTLDLTTQRLTVISFATTTYDLTALAPETSGPRITLRMLSTAALLRASAADQALVGATAAALKAEGHARLAQPLQAIVLALLGGVSLFLGGFSRFGVTRQIIVAVVLAILFQMGINVAMDLARSMVAFWPTQYVPAVIGLLVACALIWLADRPAALSLRWRDQLGLRGGAA